MKVQNLAIIFLVIAIPLIMILSYYLNLQRDTLELQAQYDTKLAEATKEGIKAFEVNTVDWSDSVSTETARRNATATVNAFITSLSNNINVSGTAKEFMSNYIPAVALTMYDGYYIYAPTYTPINKENADGIQLFYNEATGEVTTNSENGKILYEAKDGQGTSYNYQYANEDGVTITETLSNLTTDVEKAKMDYLHTLNSKMFYSAHYTKNNLDVIVNYTLDNRMSIYGENISRTGYLVYFNSNSVIPRAYARTNDPKNEDDIIVYTPFNNTNYNGTNIESEVLEEQVLYKENDTYILDTFKYIYDIEHQKLYYDETKDDFFTINSSKMRNFINQDTKNIKIGSEGCKYKSISILWGNSASTVEYKKIYQVLNGRDKGKWCMSLRNENKVPEGEMEIIDTELTDEKLQELGLGNLRFSTIYRDYSAISYYVEAYAFTNWVEQNLSGVQQVKYNEETKNNEIVPIEIGGTAVDIFRVSADNNPEDDNSPIVQHKKEVMQENVTTNLNLSISNYNRSGQYDFKLPVLSYSDWEQVFSNVSLITFFQGIPIGLKYYNNYAIATSTTNREYVDPGEIYFSGDDPNYHRVYCEKCGNIIYTGYRSVEYVMKEYVVYDDTEENNILEQIYYYQHDDKSNTNSETACYYCVVNKENFQETTDSNIKNAQAKSYNEALARERYYQYGRLTANLVDNIIISVTKKKLEITNTDIIFVLDDSGSMRTDFAAVEDACCNILDTLVGEGLSENFYIGFIRFASNASQIGYMTNASELETMKSQIRSEYGNGGGTDFSNAFSEVIRVLESEIFAGRTNQRVIIFMTDGGSSYPSSEISQLQTNGSINALYGISYGSGAALGQVVDAFKPNSQLLAANDSNLTETFENILYQINASTPETIETVDGRLDISDIEISPEKPMEITVTRGGLNIKTIVITQRPVSDEGVIIFEGGKMYLSVTALAEECGLDDFQDVSVNVTYFSGT